MDTHAVDWLRAEEINRLERMYLLGPTATIPPSAVYINGLPISYSGSITFIYGNWNPPKDDDTDD